MVVKVNVKAKFKIVLTWLNDRREAFIWLLAILILAFSEPGINHLSICPLANLGFEFCPGCGLGRSVSLLLHGEFDASLRMHYLGLFATGILTFRIIQLLFFSFKHVNNNSYEQNI